MEPSSKSQERNSDSDMGVITNLCYIFGFSFKYKNASFQQSFKIARGPYNMKEEIREIS